MRSTLDELKKELGELRALVASITPVNSALAGHQDSLVRQYVMIRRRFDYAAFVVALYASFEKFIENFVTAYVRLETSRVEYSRLPPALVKKHRVQTADLLLRGRLGEEGRYAGLREFDVVKNLFECMSGVSPYTLNEAAVVAHDANLRSGEIDALFSVVGIDKVCDRVCRADALLDWYCTAKDLAVSPQDGVPTTAVEGRLKEVVESRNRVAHRGGNPVNLNGVDEMSDALQFIEAFSTSIFAMVVGQYLCDRYFVSDQGIRLQQRSGEGPYMNGMVVVVEKPTQRLFVGQPLFVIVNAIGARWGRIRSLKIDDAVVTAVEVGDAAPNGIGISLDFKCPKNNVLVALRFDDDVVWNSEAVPATPAA